MKKWGSALVAAFIGFGLVAVPSASAKSPEAQTSLVALGDSITYGYNLGINNDHPSKEAFPYVIGQDEGFRVRDLGVPGWTSNQLLAALQTDPKFQEAVQHADVITLDIGSNDLLHGLTFNSQGNPTGVDPNAINTMFFNLNQILTLIQSQSHAKIVVYNIYNAFQPKTPLNYLSETLLSWYVNPTIQSIVATHKKWGEVELADAFTSFEGNQPTLVRLGDIHPTEEGQNVLAKIGEQALGN